MKRSPVSPQRALKGVTPDAEIGPRLHSQAVTLDPNLAFQVGFPTANTLLLGLIA